MKFYIYKIECIKNNKKYIGQTCNIKNRFNNHKYHLRKGDSTNPNLQKDFNLYGESCFVFSILKEVATREDSIQYEDYYMDLFGGIESGSIYNEQNSVNNSKCMNNKIKMSAQNNPNYGMRNKIFTKEHRYRISKGRKTYISSLSVEQRKLLFGNTNLRGNKLSPETRTKISQSLKGRIHSQETRTKISQSLKGRSLTEEHKRHLSESRKGKTYKLRGPLSEQHRNKIRLAAQNNPNYGMRGKHLSQEAKDKISQNNKNRPRPDKFTTLGTRKYSQEIINELRYLYNTGKYTYIQLSEKFNINKTTIGNLIKYGTSQNPKTYK